MQTHTRTHAHTHMHAHTCTRIHTHSHEGLIAPGGTTLSLPLLSHVGGQWSKTERCCRGIEPGPGWGWMGVKVKTGRGGALCSFLSYLPTDHSLSDPLLLLLLLLHPLLSPSSPLCGLCTCNPWVRAIKLKDLSAGGWRKSGGSLGLGSTKATGSNCGCLIWCSAIFQSDGLDIMQFDKEGVSLSRFAPSLG